MNKNIVLSLGFIVAFAQNCLQSSPMPAVQTVSTETIWNKVNRNIKGTWNGITPSWLPKMVAAVEGLGAFGLLMYNTNGDIFPATMIKNNIVKNCADTSAIFTISFLPVALIQNYLDQNTTHGIIKQSIRLIEKLQNKKLFTQSVVHAHDVPFILGDSTALQNKYPMIYAASQLEEQLVKVITLEQKCETALQYSNLADVELCTTLKNCSLALSGYRNIMNHNLHFIKNVNWNIYHAQLQLIQNDSSVQAQQMSAQAHQSNSRLAWLYAILHFPLDIINAFK